MPLAFLQAINVPRYYGIFGLIHDRLYFGGGLVPHYAAELQNVYYSNKYNLYPLSYTTSDKVCGAEHIVRTCRCALVTMVSFENDALSCVCLFLILFGFMVLNGLFCLGCNACRHMSGEEPLGDSFLCLEYCGKEFACT